MFVHIEKLLFTYRNDCLYIEMIVHREMIVYIEKCLFI